MSKLALNILLEEELSQGGLLYVLDTLIDICDQQHKSHPHDNWGDAANALDQAASMIEDEEIEEFETTEGCPVCDEVCPRCEDADEVADGMQDEPTDSCND